MGSMQRIIYMASMYVQNLNKSVKKFTEKHFVIQRVIVCNNTCSIC